MTAKRSFDLLKASPSHLKIANLLGVKIRMRFPWLQKKKKKKKKAGLLSSFTPAFPSSYSPNPPPPPRGIIASRGREEASVLGCSGQPSPRASSPRCHSIQSPGCTCPTPSSSWMTPVKACSTPIHSDTEHTRMQANSPWLSVNWRHLSYYSP